jgi:hypothetical protein
VAQIASNKKLKTRPSLSVLALVSFIAAFAIARIFSSMNPRAILIIAGVHIHHFWYGIAMLAIGGWIGISVENERANRVAAILFGGGGGIIGDQVGILLTLSAHAYWASFTYTLVIIFLAFASMLILLIRYNKIIRSEFNEFLRSDAGLYFGVFLEVISIVAISRTDNLVAITISGALAILAFLIIIASSIRRIRKRL